MSERILCGCGCKFTFNGRSANSNFLIYLKNLPLLVGPPAHSPSAGGAHNKSWRRGPLSWQTPTCCKSRRSEPRERCTARGLQITRAGERAGASALRVWVSRPNLCMLKGLVGVSAGATHAMNYAPASSSLIGDRLLKATHTHFLLPGTQVALGPSASRKIMSRIKILPSSQLEYLHHLTWNIALVSFHKELLYFANGNVQWFHGSRGSFA